MWNLRIIPSHVLNKLMIPKSLRIILRDNSIRNVNLSIRLPVFLYHVFVVFMQCHHSPELLICDVLVSPSDTACNENWTIEYEELREREEAREEYEAWLKSHE